MTETVSTAVARKANDPAALIKHYSTDFATVLPSHIKAATWIRLAEGALKRGKKVTNPKDENFGKYELQVAAANNPGTFLAALLDAARQGLEPGTEQYYLTPRRVGQRLEILGITGYQGYVELMYRSGAIDSVIVEAVYSGDKFDYRPGRDLIPLHEIDWDAEDRGSLRLVYAYARMKGGATSKVVVLNKAAIDRIKKSSQGTNSEYSPWVTATEAMWMKSAARQLRKWVPTSAEFRREEMQAAAEAQRIVEGSAGAIAPIVPEADYIEGDIVETSPAGPVSDFEDEKWLAGEDAAGGDPA